MIEIGWFQMAEVPFWTCVGLGLLCLALLVYKVEAGYSEWVNEQKRHEDYVRGMARLDWHDNMDRMTKPRDLSWLHDKIEERDPWSTPLLHALGMGSKQSVLEELGVHPGEADDNMDAFAYALAGATSVKVAPSSDITEGDIVVVGNESFHVRSNLNGTLTVDRAFGGATMSTCAYPGPAEISVQHPMPTPYVAPKNAWQGNCKSCGHRYSYADSECTHCGAQLPA